MARPKKVSYDLKAKLEKLRAAGLNSAPPPDAPDPMPEELPGLPERIRQILGLVNHPEKNKTDMLYLVMYDIEDDRVRTHIAKYLLSKGCIRIQKSVYLARSTPKLFQEINETLVEVQQLYDNHDSILLAPMQAALLGSLKIIGKDIQIQSLIDPPNTLFY